MKDLLLIFDFDDTIVSTNVEFDRTNLTTATYVSEVLFGDKRKVEEIVNYQNKVDMRLVNRIGLFRPRFLLTWYETYEHFCRKANQYPSEWVRKQIEKLVNDVYVRKFENIPTALPLMKRLKEEGYTMIILTAGENEIQHRRIRLSGVLDYVDDVMVYEHKTPETLKEVMSKHPAKDYVMIGNSLKSDIYPALANNVWGFHFERKTWDADYCEIDKTHQKYVHLDCLSQIPEQLALLVNKLTTV